ncbi:2223_t:CDS:2, partial [Ambispora gerdemannii]
FMALLSQSFNDQFARKPAYTENDLLDNLTVHCYDIDIHEKRHSRQLNNTLLIDFLKLNLHSTETYIKAMGTFASFSEFHEYLQHNVISLVADWPGQILPRKVITMQQQQVRKNIQTVENYHSLIRRQTRETDTPEQLSRTARVINCLRHDNVFQSTFVSTTKYPYCKEDLIGLTNKVSIFLLELFADIKNNTGKSEWTKRDKNKVSCHLATLNIDVDQQHLPMAFSSEYPPFDPSEKCHLQNSCKILQSTSDQSISLPCGHIYHQCCLQYLEHKYTSIGEDDSEVDLSQENEVQSTNNDNGVEDLSKQPLFNLKTSN